MNRHNIEQVIFLLLVLLVFAWAAWDAFSFPEKAQTYPRTVALAAVIITLVELGSYTMTLRTQPSGEAAVSDSVSTQFFKILPYLFWLGAFYAAIYLMGIIVASGLFVFIFLLREGKMAWYYALLSGLIVIGFLLTMEDVMSLKWPRSVIDPILLLGLG